MIRHRSIIGLGLVLFLVLDAMGLMFLSSPPRVYSALAPTATPRRQPTRIPSPTPTPRRQTRSLAAQSTDWHVCGGGGGDFTTIQAAVDAAAPGDVIKVAAGVYTESKPSTSANLYISKTLFIYGGYMCGSWTTQDPVANVTTIRPTTTTLSVVTITGLGGNPTAVTPTLDGFTITGGRGDLGFYHGGGLRIRSSNALINNNIITGNIAYLLGGGIWVQGGAPLIQNNRIQNNLTNYGGYGGGVELESTQATLSGNIIASNAITDVGGSGGGVAIFGGGPVTLSGNTILSNTAAITGTGYGGGVSILGVPIVTATLTNNIIQGNTAAAYTVGPPSSPGYGGGISILNSGAFTLTNNTVMSNYSGYALSNSPPLYGGGILVQSSQGLLAGNIISGNVANGWGGANPAASGGGGIAVLTSTLNVQGGQISNNNLSTFVGGGYGGGLFALNSSIAVDSIRVQKNDLFTAGRVAVAFFNSPYTLTNALITDNYNVTDDAAVSGIFADASSPGLLVNNTIANNNAQGIRTGSALTATNNIIMGHTTGISLTAAVPVSVTFNDFYNNTANVRGFSLDLSNIVINPNLDATFHLNPGSPAIDAGTHTNAPDHDMDGEPRPMVGTSGLFKVDIGADEFPGTAQVNRRLATQPADFTLIGPGNPTENPGSTGPNDWIGYAAWGGDINGDNRADLIVGAPNLSDMFDGGPDDSGRVFAVYNNGTRRLGVMDLYTTTANLEVRSYINQQHIGQSFATADLNGGGARDLIIGAPGAAAFSVTGTVFAFQGGAGLSGTKTLSPTMQATWRFRSGENTGTFGGKNSLATGRLAGSTADDLVVAEGNATGPGNRTQAGAVFVFFGSNSLPALWDLKTTPASLTIYGPANFSQLSRVAVCDVNGDGRSDLIVRSPTTAYVFYGPLPSGTIDLGNMFTHADATITGLDGDWLACGDVDGDGKADIILGRSNEVDIVRGGTLGSTQSIGAAAWARFTGVAPTTLYSFDWNGDGKSDVMIGDWNNNRAFVVFGGASLPNPADIFDSANWVITGENINDQFGYSFGGADLDADGALDLIIGSRSHVVTNHPLHFEDAGAVYVFYGTGTGALNQKIYLPHIMK